MEQQDSIAVTVDFSTMLHALAQPWEQVKVHWRGRSSMNWAGRSSPRMRYANTWPGYIPRKSVISPDLEKELYLLNVLAHERLPCYAWGNAGKPVWREAWMQLR